MPNLTRLLIARHGNTFAPDDVVRRVGLTDLPLVASGLEQGRKLGTYLREHDLVPDIIYTSQLKRAQQTAEEAQAAMQTGLPINTLSIFNEIDYGPDENQPESEVVARVGADTLKLWEANATVPAGWNVDPQTIIRDWQRFADQIENEYAGKIILVVTSNGIARFSPHLTGDFSAFSRQHGIKISTGALCIFEKRKSEAEWNCVQWNVKPT